MRKKIVSFMVMLFVVTLFLPVNLWATTDVIPAETAITETEATTDSRTPDAQITETPDADTTTTETPDTDTATTETPDTDTVTTETPDANTTTTETPDVDTATTEAPDAEEIAAPAPLADTTNGPLRYAVLILDTSGSMGGEPISIQKQAAIKFCDSLLQANGETYIALIEFNNSAKTLINFTQDVDSIKTAINATSAHGGTDTAGALNLAETLISQVPSTAIRNIILCSDGVPTTGESNALNQADVLKNSNCFVYSLAFLHGSNTIKAETLMRQIANAGCYIVNKASLDQLNFTFDQIGIDMLDPITQDRLQELYKKYKKITIACPVNVVVKDPSGRQIALLNADGTAMVNNMYNAYFSIMPTANNDFIKVLNIPDGEDYKVELEGTGEGTMNVFIEKYDETGLINSTSYENIPVTLGSTGSFDFGNAYTDLGTLTFNQKNHTSSYVPAKREAVSSNYDRYDVELSQSNGGEIKANSKRITNASLVKLTVTPEYGYKLGTLTVTASDGTTITAKRQKDGTYAFTMPKMNVRVTATFLKK